MGEMPDWDKDHQDSVDAMDESNSPSPRPSKEEVVICNVDDWVIDSLRRQARANAQSLQDSLHELLLREALRPRRELAKRHRRMLSVLFKKYGMFSDSALIIREDRDMRG